MRIVDVGDHSQRHPQSNLADLRRNVVSRISQAEVRFDRRAERFGGHFAFVVGKKPVAHHSVKSGRCTERTDGRLEQFFHALIVDEVQQHRADLRHRRVGAVDGVGSGLDFQNASRSAGYGKTKLELLVAVGGKRKAPQPLASKFDGR